MTEREWSQTERNRLSIEISERTAQILEGIVATRADDFLAVLRIKGESEVEAKKNEFKNIGRSLRESLSAKGENSAIVNLNLNLSEIVTLASLFDERRDSQELLAVKDELIMGAKREVESPKDQEDSQDLRKEKIPWIKSWWQKIRRK